MTARRRGRHPAARVAVALAAMLALWGCSTTYVARAAYEEARILWRRRPIDRMLADPGLDPARRAKLELVVAARRFAADQLGLRVGGSYGAVSDVDERAVVQLLSAARRDRLRPYTWWFPIVGRVPYKGFFSRAAAESTAADLERQGYDTYVRPAIAFSTLGWFDDPLLSNLLARGRVALVDTVFHELFHNTVYVPGATDFNESAANFVGHRATIDFFCDGSHADAADCAEASADWRDALAISAFLRAALAELGAFYDTGPKGDALEVGRQRIFESIRERFRALPLSASRFTRLGERGLNNAILLHDRAYFRELDLLEDLHGSRGGLTGALAEIRHAAEAGGDPFERLRERLEPPRRLVRQ